MDALANSSRRPARFASVVVEDLAREIISGKWAERDLVPTEPALCEEFGFSRTVIREALKLMEERGLVRVEQGRGTSVKPRSSWNVLDPLVLRIALEYDHDMSLLDNLITVRRVLEREMASAAAERLTDEELAALAEHLERMEAEYDDYARFQALDRSFHSILNDASGNEVGASIVRVIHRHGGARPPLSAAATRAELARTANDHRRIYEALAARDGSLAGELISEHIDSAWAARKRQRRRPPAASR
jgi:GntR family transcriptional regulator, galactonate operon transcriptional repressor